MSFHSCCATWALTVVRGAALEELLLEGRHQLVDLLADRLPSVSASLGEKPAICLAICMYCSW
jgi:hypothetical protein